MSTNVSYADIAWTNETKLKKNYLGKKNKPHVSYLINDRFTHARLLLKTLNALNFYQINLLQVILFMHKIKTNSSLESSYISFKQYTCNSVLQK